MTSRQWRDDTGVDPDALHARLEAALLSTSVSGRFARSAPPSFQSTAPPSSPSTAPTPTPPPDLEARAKLWHEMEDKAHNLMEQDGCPPCHPPDPSFSVQNPPEEYRGMISYWDWFASTEGGALHAQWEDWCKFRSLQERNRRYYAQKFEQFTKVVRERRRRHNLSEDDVNLRLNAKEQTRQENWIEFQDYHLRYHEDYEKKVEIESKNLETETKKLSGLADSELEIAKHNQMAYRYRLGLANERMELHQQRLLPWIERQRIKMTTVPTQPAATPDDISVIPICKPSTPSTRNNRRKPPKMRSSPANSVPSTSAISKRESSRKRSLKIKEPPPKTARESDASSRRGRALHPHSQNMVVTKPVKISKKKIHQSKKQQANINIDAASRLLPKPRKKPPPALAGGSRVAYQDQNLTETKDAVTKSGRVSRRPRRSGFVSF